MNVLLAAAFATVLAGGLMSSIAANAKADAALVDAALAGHALSALQAEMHTSQGVEVALRSEIAALRAEVLALDADLQEGRRAMSAAGQRTLSLDFLRWADSGVAFCESSNDPAATNGRYIGLMQVDPALHAAKLARYGWGPEDMRRSVPNLVVAHDIWLEAGGTGPWPVCREKGRWPQ